MTDRHFRERCGCFQPLLALNPGPGSSTAQPGARHSGTARRRFSPETTQSTYNASPNITPSRIGVSPSVGWHRSAPYFWAITRPKLSKVVREGVSLPIPVAYRCSIPPLVHALFLPEARPEEHGSTTDFPASRAHPDSLRASPSSSHSPKALQALVHQVRAEGIKLYPAPQRKDCLWQLTRQDARTTERPIPTAQMVAKFHGVEIPAGDHRRVPSVVWGGEGGGGRTGGVSWKQPPPPAAGQGGKECHRALDENENGS